MTHQEQEAKAFLILLTFVMSVLFMSVDASKRIKPFPFYQKWEKGIVVSTTREISIENYIYYLNEYLILIVAFHIIKTEATRFNTYYKFVFGALVFDVFDYLLTFNTEWFYIGVMPVSANVIIMVVLFISFIFSVWKDQD